MNSRKLGLIVLILTTLLYIIIIWGKFYFTITYIILLAMVVLSICLLNRFKILRANILFCIYYLYSIAIGPIFIMDNMGLYKYNFFTLIIGSLMCFAYGNLILPILPNMKKVREAKKIGISRIFILRVLYIISIFASVYYLIKNRQYIFGGNLQGGRITALSGSGLVFEMLKLPILIIPMMYDLYFETKGGKKILLEIIFMTIVSSVTLVATGFRAFVLTLYVCLIIMIIEKNNIKNTKIIPIGIALVLLVEVLGNMRSSLSGGKAGSLKTSLIVNLYNLQYIFNTFPTKVSFQNGYTYLINFIMLKPGPDLDFTLWLKTQLGLSFSGGGVTPTVLGEFYINFGFKFIFIGMFFMGTIGNYISRYFDKNSKNFLATYLTWQFAHCISGGIANVIVSVIMYIFLYKVLMLFKVQNDEGNLINEK